MKKNYIAIILFLMAVFGKLNAQESASLIKQNTYQNFNDSILLSIKEIIKNDLIKNDIHVADGKQNWLGVSYELKVIFNYEFSYIMSSQRPILASKKYKKYSMKSILSNSNSLNFKKYIIENNKFPFDRFEYIEYHFLTELINSDSGIYGRYKFNISPSGFTIIDTYTEILKDKNAVFEKIYANW